LSATILIGTGISASAFSHQFKGDVEIYEKASRIENAFLSGSSLAMDLNR